MDFIYFLGRFHVLALHLPIGIICALFVLELLARKPRFAHLQAASPYLWAATAVSAIITVLFGYMHFAEGGFVGSSAFLHRNLGTLLAIVATAIALVRVSPFAEGFQRLFFPASILMVLLSAVVGHYGGNLTHGSTYLVEYAPQPLRSLAGLAPRRQITSLAEANAFEDVVQPMLGQRCEGCHNPDKRESGLDLTSFDSVMKGGEGGRVVVPGNSSQSELLRRITVDPASDEFMPAEGKTPLTAQQTQIIEWWIAAGASADRTVEELQPSSEVRALLSAELGLESGG